MLEIMNIVGARPNFMKIAPICHAIDARDGVSSTLVHTGQHYDDNLSDVFFDELGIPRPDINLGVGGGSREEQIERISAAFEPVMTDRRPDLILVVGDVNSTIACASVAKKHGVPVAHVEAGLRSFDMEMPEEHNRTQTDRISDYLFITEPSGMENLEREANPGKRFYVGNVMIDTLIANLPKARETDVHARLGLASKRGRSKYAVTTFHRPSNVDSVDGLNNVLSVIREICAQIQLVLPLHPRTRSSLESHGLIGQLDGIDNLIVSEPLGYLEFLNLVCEAQVVVTDSGGIQEETTYLGVPCITMRENTERPVTISVGTNVLVGSDRAALMDAFNRVMSGQTKSAAIPEHWDGHAAERIIDILCDELGQSR